MKPFQETKWFENLSRVQELKFLLSSFLLWYKRELGNLFYYLLSDIQRTSILPTDMEGYLKRFQLFFLWSELLMKCSISFSQYFVSNCFLKYYYLTCDTNLIGSTHGLFNFELWWSSLNSLSSKSRRVRWFCLAFLLENISHRGHSLGSLPLWSILKAAHIFKLPSQNSLVDFVLSSMLRSL